jgi:ornithine carbamoyltransferase
MKPRHYLDITEWSSQDFMELLDLAVFLKREWKSGGNRPVLAGKVLAWSSRNHPCAPACRSKSG